MDQRQSFNHFYGNQQDHGNWGPDLKFLFEFGIGVLVVVAAVAGSIFGLVRVANGQELLDRERAVRVLKTYPKSEDSTYAKFYSAAMERGIPYDDELMPPMTQDGDSNRQGLHGVNSTFGRRHSSLHDFPWAVGFGMTRAKNAERDFTLVLPLKPNGKPYPIVWRTAKAKRFDNRNNIENPTYHWMFPPGTIVAERIKTHGINFQVNILERTVSHLEPDVVRMFRDNYEFATALKDTGREPRLVEALLREQVEAEEFQEVDTVHELKVTFNSVGMTEELPPFEDKVFARKFLQGRGDKFVSVKNAMWRYSNPPVLAPTVPVGAGPHIVAEGFRGGVMSVTRDNCKQCHQDTGFHVSHFDQLNEFNGISGIPDPGNFATVNGRRIQLRKDRPLTQDRVQRQNGRHWYGLVRGSDGILSFHIFEPRFIQQRGINGGGFAEVNRTENPESILRKELLNAGLLERYDSKVHPGQGYNVLTQSHN